MEKTIKELITKLNEYNKYYDLGQPIISDKEYDDLYFKLVDLEKESGIYFPDSPTQHIDYEIKNELTKVEHNHMMLSLDKTKDWNEFLDYFKFKNADIMVKLDGLTCSLKYADGVLIGAETRGNGIIGEDILHNAKVVSNIPQKIPYDEELVVDGEIICTYQDFEKWSDIYKNPRNFASGSIRLLDSHECANRNLTFVVWNVIKGFEEENCFYHRLDMVKDLGFEIVPYTTSFDGDTKEFLQNQAKELGYPIDGLVGRFDNIEYGNSLGNTEHHSRAAYAFKFYDETYETRLTNIEWSMGRTGVLTPVAIFEPIDIDGSTVSRASLHNLSILDQTLGIPVYHQKLWVYKANQIIPQIYEAEQHPEATTSFADIGYCPCCGKKLVIWEHNGIEDLMCDNPTCEGKLINQLDHYCSKSGLDIKGLSEKTLEKLMDWGWLDSICDIYTLREHRAEWIKKSGFGIASVDKILTAIDGSKETNFVDFLSAIGVPLVGKTIAKLIEPYVESWEDFRMKIQNILDKKDKCFHFYSIDGIGVEIETNIINFDYEKNADKIIKNYLHLNKKNDIINISNENSVKNKTFVITGSVHIYKNRDEIKTKIESLGGKVVGSVSKKTDYLINNDVNSTSAKNKKAKELNIPIISEEDFEKLF